MNKYVGELVEHNSYGTGQIIACDEENRTITVKYQYKESVVLFPTCFKKFVRFKNPVLQDEITRVLENETALNQPVDSKLLNSLKANTIVYGGFKGKSKNTDNDIDIPIYKSYEQFLGHQERMLSEEISAIRSGRGGKKTRIQNGQLIERRGLTYFYIFEADTELFLPDDTEIQIWRKDGSYVYGTAIHCEDFTVIIACKEYFGENDLSLEFSAEPWQLIQYLIDRLKSIQEKRSEIVNDLIYHGSEKIDRNSSIIKGQEAAVRMSISQPITFVWGPPGTGKTETLAKIAIQHMKKGYRVLMVSYSNVSVDGATWRVYDRSADKTPGNILRYGYPRDKGLLDHDYLTSYRYVLKKHPDLAEQQTKLSNEKRTCNRKTPRYIEIEERLSRIRATLSREEKETIQKTPFIATTIAKALADKTIFEDQYDTVIFDEASMAYIPQVIFAANLARKHFICMGDFNQLPPIVQQDDSCCLNADIFSFCGITDAVRMRVGHQWLCMLDVQHRMYPDIADYSSEHMYNSLLKSADDMEIKRRQIVQAKPYQGKAVNLVDLSGMMSVCMLSGDSSRINVLSAMIDIAVAVQAAKKYEVGIITPYHSQSRLLHAMARSVCSLHPELHPIKCSTVHQFQGSEMPVIIFDAVDCYRQQFPGILLSSKKNAYADRLFNVALTRAQGKFIAVANVDYMQEKNLPIDLLLREMIDDLQGEADRGERLMANISSDVVLTGTDTQHRDKFFDDIRNAKKEIRIDIPAAKTGFDEQFFHSLALEIKEALFYKATLLVRAENPEIIPKPLSECASRSSRAYNPITIIDRRVIWFGYPCTKGNFELKDGTSIKTTTRPVVRIEGKEVANALINMLEMSHVKETGFWDLYVPDFVPKRRGIGSESGMNRGREKEPAQPGITRKSTGKPALPINTAHAVIINRFKRHGIRYLDLTAKGGAIYFFDKTMADELKKEGLTILYAANGTKSTKGEPAWYVKL